MATMTNSISMTMFPNSAPKPRWLISAAMPRPAAMPAIGPSHDRRGAVCRSSRSGGRGRLLRGRRTDGRATLRARRAAPGCAACRWHRRRRCGVLRRRAAASRSMRPTRARDEGRVISCVSPAGRRGARQSAAIIRAVNEPKRRCAGRRAMQGGASRGGRTAASRMKAHESYATDFARHDRHPFGFNAAGHRHVGEFARRAHAALAPLDLDARAPRSAWTSRGRRARAGRRRGAKASACRALGGFRQPISPRERRGRGAPRPPRRRACRRRR